MWDIYSIHVYIYYSVVRVAISAIRHKLHTRTHTLNSLDSCSWTPLGTHAGLHNVNFIPCHRLCLLIFSLSLSLKTRECTRLGAQLLLLQKSRSCCCCFVVVGNCSVSKNALDLNAVCVRHSNALIARELCVSLCARARLRNGLAMSQPCHVDS